MIQFSTEVETSKGLGLSERKTGKNTDSKSGFLKQFLTIEKNYRFLVLAFALLEEQEQLSLQIINALTEKGLCHDDLLREDLASIARKKEISPEELSEMIFSPEQIAKMQQLDPIIRDKMWDHIFVIRK